MRAGCSVGFVEALYHIHEKLKTDKKIILRVEDLIHFFKEDGPYGNPLMTHYVGNNEVFNDFLEMADKVFDKMRRRELREHIDEHIETLKAQKYSAEHPDVPVEAQKDSAKPADSEQ